ncbi:hypothetical protein ElyMa_007015400 [Elysia marginata]|uniref:Uncharacterized protein n=1 Tax=Elysia marginata TaxID=1093978 RepID=A0AAV4JTC8_9GAST|nr:hypothetical protein ElyMa_007015400 [Elysia marginata]
MHKHRSTERIAVIQAPSPRPGNMTFVKWKPRYLISFPKEEKSDTTDTMHSPRHQETSQSTIARAKKLMLVVSLRPSFRYTMMFKVLLMTPNEAMVIVRTKPLMSANTLYVLKLTSGEVMLLSSWLVLFTKMKELLVIAVGSIGSIAVHKVMF